MEVGRRLWIGGYRRKQRRRTFSDYEPNWAKLRLNRRECIKQANASKTKQKIDTLLPEEKFTENGSYVRV